MSLDLTFLNPSQLEAVTTAGSNTLILAGPGTGKTSTLAYRIAYLISACGVKPENIVAVTFTSKAAQEMKERIIKLVWSQESKIRSQESGDRSQKTDDSQLSTPDSGLNICTFHSLGLAILREEGHRVGLPSDFRILSESEQGELVKEILPEVLPHEPLNRARKWTRLISEHKNLIFDRHSQLPLLSDFPDALFSSYETRLRALNLIDFDDLILKPLIILREHPNVRDNYRNRFHYILVDEYQDLNNAQYHFLRELCGSHAHLWVIGDADQAIYAFRGANVKYFLRFKEDYPGTRTINLEKNYRSTGTILTGAQAVITNNTNRIPSTLTPLHLGGLPLYLFQASDHRNEARFVVKEIEKIIGGIRMESSFEVQETFGFSEVAILYRLHNLSYSFSEALQEAGIPFQIVGGFSSHSDSALGWLIASLKVVLNPHDDLSLRMILPLIDKRFDSKTVAQLVKSAGETHCSLFSFLKNQVVTGISEYGQVVLLQRIVASIERFQQESHSISLEQFIKTIFQELKVKEVIEGKRYSEWCPFAEPFLEGPAYQQVPRFLETLSLLKEGETYNPESEAVTLMTVHAAKGLEFPVVFMVGLESGIFPCTEFGEEPTDVEEERRLFYVGMTRAKQRLYLSYSKERYLFGENRKNIPSPFISEIPQEVIETISDFRKPSKLNKKPKVKQRTLFS